MSSFRDRLSKMFCGAFGNPDADPRELCSKDVGQAEKMLEPHKVELTDFIGGGKFYVMFKAETNDDQKKMDEAIKMIRHPRKTPGYDEYEVIQALTPHRNVCIYYGFIDCGSHRFIRMELALRTMTQEIAINGRLPERRYKAFFRQMLHALRHLHKLGIIHRNVRLNSVLVYSNQLLFKLTDFSCALMVKPNSICDINVVATTGMTAEPDHLPEFHAGEPFYCYELDAWQLMYNGFTVATNGIPLEADTDMKDLIKRQNEANVEFHNCIYSLPYKTQAFFKEYFGRPRAERGNITQLLTGTYLHKILQ